MSSAEDPTGSLVSTAEALLDVGRYADGGDAGPRRDRAGAPGPRPFRTLSRALYGLGEPGGRRRRGEAIRLAPDDGTGYRLCSRAL